VFSGFVFHPTGDSDSCLVSHTLIKELLNSSKNSNDSQNDIHLFFIKRMRKEKAQPAPEEQTQQDHRRFP